MSIETRSDGADAGETDDVAESGESVATAEAEERNTVAVHFSDGEVATYAFVVREADSDWLHAERLVGDGDGLDDEEVEAINADAVTRVRAEEVQHCEHGAVYHGSGLLVDPDALLEDCGLGD